MGASKRLCEMVVQTLDKVGKLQAAGKELKEPVLGVHTEDNTKINGPTQILREAFKLTNKKLNTKSRVLEIIK